MGLPRKSLLPGALLWLLFPAGVAQGPDDATLKARLAMAVARFAEFPGGTAGTPLRFCVVAKGGSVPRAFAQLDGQRIGGRVVSMSAVPAAVECDIVFVAEGVADWRALMQATGASALTIGEVDGFLAAGGMIELVIENDALRFDVNLDAARRRRIRLPGQVLKLARRVVE